MTVQMRGSEGGGECNRLIMWLGGLQAERGNGGRKRRDKQRQREMKEEKRRRGGKKNKDRKKEIE